MAKLYKCTVEEVSKLSTGPPAIILIADDAGIDWCEQYTQEGYDVLHVNPNSSDSEVALENILQMLPRALGGVALITFGIGGDALQLISEMISAYSLNACIHYCPQLVDGKPLWFTSVSGRHVPTIFHISSIQEQLHASLFSHTNPSSLPYALPPAVRFPLKVYTYPLVPSAPPFPFLARAPSSIRPESLGPSIDPHILSATNLAYTRTLELLKSEVGPHFDLEKIWGEHIYYEFEERSALKTMQTMVDVPYVNHIPTLTGGVGYDELARFYKHHFTGKDVTPPDTEMITVSRTVGADRIIDEMIFKCTHTTEIDYFLPGIKPTGKSLEIALVGVIAFRGNKLCFEHIYWDQASALVQLGLLDDRSLPVAGKEVAAKVLDPYGIPSNKHMKRWKESEGKPIN